MFTDLKKTIKEVEGGFGRPHILVVGDLMVDQYYWGKVERISPEAPIPVVRLENQTYSPGGAANVACNLAKLGCKVSLAGIVGADENGKRLLQLLEELAVNTSLVLVLPERATTVKTRVLGGHQQVVRIDAEDHRPLSQCDYERLLRGVTRQMVSCSAVVLSDYAKGVLQDAVCQRIIAEGHRHSLPVLVEPKGCDYGKYARATMLSPNRLEIATATGSPQDDLDLLFQRAEALRAALEVGFFALTLGELGIAVLEHGSVFRFPALAREVFDVSGAGDAVIAVWAAGLAGGLERHDCAQLANLAAGIVIGKVGTVPVSRQELLATLSRQSLLESSDKICTYEQLQERVALWHARRERIAFTSGCFDLLHFGHVTLLQLAKHEGDRLVVGLNSDHSVRALKGAGRPLVGELERARLLASMSLVDAVILFDEETPLKLIQSLQPDVLVKGADPGQEQVVGAAEVRSWGGKITLVPLVEGCSTTTLVEKLNGLGTTSQVGTNGNRESLLCCSPADTFC